MWKPPVLACVLLACAACHGDKHVVASPPRSPTAATPVTKLDPHLALRIESLGAPVRSARTWTTALVPNARGGWNFITQSLEAGTKDLPEWVVVDLQAGSYSVKEGSGRYANSNYTVANQLRASNGRVFFPLSDTGLAYYDPSDETVKELAPLVSTSDVDKILFSATFGPDGMLYFGTQSNALPTIVQVNPVTLATRVIGNVGRDRKTYSYAYRIAVDPPWVYATVGQMPWELAALNIKTGKSKILATRADRPWMDLETHPEGIRVQLISGAHTPAMVRDYVWCVEGEAIPAGPNGKLPVKARKLASPPAPPTDAPELDVTRINPDRDGIGRIGWRRRGSHDWKVVEYKVKHTTPIKIESLTALPDGSVLGATQQYHGFFNTRGSSSTMLGGPSPSQSKFAVLDGLLYTTGYPNSVLYAFDPKKPWTSTTTESATALGSNPHQLGNFTESGAKYAYFLTPSRNRLYFAGRLERTGVGAGVGYYEPATKKFAGHHTNLDDVVPAGLVVPKGLERVVLSQRLRDSAPDRTSKHAELVIYNSDLVETDRLVVKPGLASTGVLYSTHEEGVIVGLLPDAVYRYDVAAKRLLEWRELTGKFEAVDQRPADGSLWGVVGTSMIRIDPRTLELQTFGTAGSLPAGIELLVWQGDDLYASVGADLYRIRRVGLP